MRWYQCTKAYLIPINKDYILWRTITLFYSENKVTENNPLSPLISSIRRYLVYVSLMSSLSDQRSLTIPIGTWRQRSSSSLFECPLRTSKKLALKKYRTYHKVFYKVFPKHLYNNNRPILRKFLPGTLPNLLSTNNWNS